MLIFLIIEIWVNFKYKYPFTEWVDEEKKERKRDPIRKRTNVWRRSVRDQKSTEKSRFGYTSGKKVDTTCTPSYAEVEKNQDLDLDKMSESNQCDTNSIVVRANLTEKRKKYCFYRNSVNSQVKQQVKPTEFGKYGGEPEPGMNLYQSPVIGKFPSSI